MIKTLYEINNCATIASFRKTGILKQTWFLYFTRSLLWRSHFSFEKKSDNYFTRSLCSLMRKPDTCTLTNHCLETTGWRGNQIPVLLQDLSCSRTSVWRWNEGGYRNTDYHVQEPKNILFSIVKHRENGIWL